MIAVHTTLAAYRAAIAELPLRTRLGDSPAGAIVVVPGDAGWVDAVLAAAEAGAAAVVVADPALAPAADVRELADRMTVPVVVERALLRPDVADAARAARADSGAVAHPRAVVLDGAAPEALLGVVTRDAIGWGRVLAGQTPSPTAGDGLLALLETPAGTPVTLCLVTTRRPGRGWVRAQVLDEVTTEVSIEGRESRVVTATASGRLTAPTRFESSERLALRRAVDAMDAGGRPDDLAVLAVDTDVAERVVSLRT
jgi:hypothetical protein